MCSSDLLDQYTSGDLLISGRSTKEFRDRDWDAYRNHSIGFVFQSYNLIPHQSVLQNVELALTLSGVSKAERRRRAAEALEKVGLGDQPVIHEVLLRLLRERVRRRHLRARAAAEARKQRQRQTQRQRPARPLRRLSKALDSAHNSP